MYYSVTECNCPINKKVPQMQGYDTKVYLGRGLNWQGAVPQTQPPASR